MPPNVCRQVCLLWHARAACRTAPLEVSWFPGTGQETSPAKAVCATCQVIEHCRTWALAQGAELRGIWGGLAEGERQQLRRGKAV